MLSKIIYLSFAFILTACASTQPLTSQRAVELTPMALCRIAYFDEMPENSMQVALTELKRRKFDCSPHIEAISKKIAVEDELYRIRLQQLSNTMAETSRQLQQQKQQINSNNYRPIHYGPTTTNCYKIGNSVRCSSY